MTGFFFEDGKERPCWCGYDGGAAGPRGRDAGKPGDMECGCCGRPMTPHPLSIGAHMPERGACPWGRRPLLLPPPTA